MSTSMIVVLVVVLVVALVAIALVLRTRRTQKLKSRFGPEYGRAVEQAGREVSPKPSWKSSKSVYKDSI